MTGGKEAPSTLAVPQVSLLALPVTSFGLPLLVPPLPMPPGTIATLPPLTTLRLSPLVLLPPQVMIATLENAPLRRTEALVPRQQEHENALQASPNKRSAETSAAYSIKTAARTLSTPALKVPFLPISQRQAALRRPSDDLREKTR